MTKSRTGIWLGLVGGAIVAAAVPSLQAATSATHVAPVDADGDGHASIASGGADCDDGDANRYPGNVEVCDAGHKDEDCNPTTYGKLDADGDGFFKAQCCNRTASDVRCGNDPDDANPAIVPGAIVCSGETPHVVAIDGQHEARTCTSGTTCIEQPNATGICAPRPRAFAAASTKTLWKKPSTLAPSPSPTKKPTAKPGPTTAPLPSPKLPTK